MNKREWDRHSNGMGAKEGLMVSGLPRSKGKMFPFRDKRG